MKIIKKGRLKTESREFTCPYCDSVFVAERGEYHHTHKDNRKSNLHMKVMNMNCTSTTNERELLLKDLCSRLPYNFVYCFCNNPLAKGKPIILTPVVISNLMNATDELVIKPYLRPMSSMTKEEKSLFLDLRNALTYQENGEYDLDDFNELNNFLNKRILDRYGLIDMGLALEAPEGMYNNKMEE